MTINPAPTLDNLGGKGLQLTQLKKICDVPEFFVINFTTISEIDDYEVQKQILNFFDDFGGNLVAVRSSATLEDSNRASFAGVFETVLNVNRDTLISSILSVLKSASNSRVEEYCRINLIDFSSIQMRIVVQKMVKSRVSGVCFTRESHNSNYMLIEACYGLGEALVSGIATPDTYKVDRDSFEKKFQKIGFQKVMYNNASDVPVRLPFYLQNAKKLTDDEINTIAKICMSVEHTLGYYSADIEWAFENDKIKLLQVRPFVGVQ